jgi:hypothetical protein
VELDALHFRRQLLAQRLILLLVRLRELLAGAHRLHARALQLGEFLEKRRDVGEFLERLRLQRFFHLGEGKGVVLFLLSAGRGVRRSTMLSSSSSSVGRPPPALPLP